MLVGSNNLSIGVIRQIDSCSIIETRSIANPIQFFQQNAYTVKFVFQKHYPAEKRNSTKIIIKVDFWKTTTEEVFLRWGQACNCKIYPDWPFPKALFINLAFFKRLDSI